MLWQLHKESRGTVLGADNQVMRCTNQFFFSTLILFEYSNNLSFSVFMCFKHILKLYFWCQNHPLVYQSVLSVPYKTSIGPSILLSFSSLTALLFCAPTRIKISIFSSLKYCRKEHHYFNFITAYFSSLKKIAETNITALIL